MQGGTSAQQSLATPVYVGQIVLAFWVLTPIILFVLGRVLGAFTLSLARHSIGGGKWVTAAIGVFARLLYRIVIALSILYFYIALPILVLAIFAVIVGLLNYAESGQSRIYIVVLLALVITSFLPVLVAMFVGGSKRKERVRLLTREEAPVLWNVVEDVARRVGTRPVDSIWITPHTSISVREESGRILRFQVPHRQLEVGFGALSGMTQTQFKAILAHEYGHFSNRDTVGGNWAWRLQSAIGETMVALEESAADSRSVPWIALLFSIRFLVFTYYRRVFLPITIGATRLQEMMADRYAALAYGGQNFADGLTHIVRRSLVFKVQHDLEVRAAGKAKRRIQNLYTLPALETATEKQVDALFEKVMHRQTSVYDTHPAPYERIKLIRSLEAAVPVETSEEPVWNLLANTEALQMEMTGVIQTVLYSHYGHAWAR